jgi:hypothetical protein
MIELVDTSPDVTVQAAEYQRLLGYPRDFVMNGRALELAAWAREWYAKNGRPWMYARQADSFQIAGDTICIDGVSFSSRRLQNTLQRAEAHGVILVAVGAGSEIEEEAQRLWQEEKPDEYFFLEMLGSAVVEHLTTMTGARLCSWAEEDKMAVLPHYSPGYPEWDIAEQPRLLELMKRTRKQTWPCQMEVLDSGMLRPKKSLLAVFGVTQHTDRLRRLTDLVPCENCSFMPCQYRRAGYVRTPGVLPVVPVAVQLNPNASYAVNRKALERWANERLSLEVRDDCTVDALFRYDGTTCTNMGRPLTFNYNVKLGTREEGYPIREQRCGPAPGDSGHKYMCRYISGAEQLMESIDREKPLLGQPLNDVLVWLRPPCAAGCYCEPDSREHKWGLVLETIHYALSQREIRRETQ